MDPGILNSIARVWTETSAPGHEAPNEHAISVVLIEAPAEEIFREVRPKVDLEPMHAHPLEVTVTKLCPAPAAGHRRGAVPKGEGPGLEAPGEVRGMEAPEDIREVVRVAADWVEASGISSNLN